MMQLDENVENANRRMTLHDDIMSKFNFTGQIKDDFVTFIKENDDIFTLAEDRNYNRKREQQANIPADRRKTKQKILNDFDKSALLYDPNILEANDL